MHLMVPPGSRVTVMGMAGCGAGALDKVRAPPSGARGPGRRRAYIQ